MKRRTCTTVSIIGHNTYRPFVRLKSSPGDGDHCNLYSFLCQSDGRTNVAIIKACLPSGGMAGQVEHLQIRDILATIGGSNIVSTISHRDNVELRFRLLPGKPFCESSITLAFVVLLKLGMNEGCVKDLLKQSQIVQHTEVKYRDKWVEYMEYMRCTHPALVSREPVRF